MSPLVLPCNLQGHRATPRAAGAIALTSAKAVLGDSKVIATAQSIVREIDEKNFLIFFTNSALTKRKIVLIQRASKKIFRRLD